MDVNKEIIISLTSYPLRIHYVNDVLKSLLEQETTLPFKIVLVLSLVEFPQQLNNLPQDLLDTLSKNSNKIEIIWYEKNIRSHKKLIPTLKKYPHNPILIIDDDIIRLPGYVQRFINDHKKYPNDIICGTFMYFINDKNEFTRFTGQKGVASGCFNNIPNMVFRFSRPANGCGGVLYPPNTFTDERFFDEEQLSEICPYSDESWQFMFNILENRNLRQLSVVYDNSEGVLPGSQATGLYKKNKYDRIFQRLYRLYPEFLFKVRERQYNEIIVSMASWGDRLKEKITDIAINSLLKQTLKPYKIILTIYEDDKKYLSDYLLELNNDNKIEINIVNENLKSHNKYFWTMLKYRNNPIVIVDDDIEYTRDMIESLAVSYVNHPDCISARRTHMITFDENGIIKPYKKWEYECNKQVDTPNILLFATGGGGVLFPPDILNVKMGMISEIKKHITVDDMYLKHLEIEKGIKTVYVENLEPMGKPIINETVTKTALYKINCTKNENDKHLHLLYKLNKNSITKQETWTPVFP